MNYPCGGSAVPAGVFLLLFITNSAVGIAIKLPKNTSLDRSCMVISIGDNACALSIAF